MKRELVLKKEKKEKSYVLNIIFINRYLIYRMPILIYILLSERDITHK